MVKSKLHKEAIRELQANYLEIDEIRDPHVQKAIDKINDVLLKLLGGEK